MMQGPGINPAPACAYKDYLVRIDQAALMNGFITIHIFEVAPTGAGYTTDAIEIDSISDCCVCGLRRYKKVFYSATCGDMWYDICNTCLDPDLVSKDMVYHYIGIYNNVYIQSMTIEEYLKTWLTN